MAEDGAETRPGISPEILRQVRRIELRTRRLVDSRFSGEYHSVFKGQGLEFAEVREYLPGDDVRTIDWNVTARAGRPYVKKYVEERELTVLLAVDVSGSLEFGTVGRFKSELVAEVAAVLALSAARNNDRVGLLLFSDGVELFVRPRKGRRHALRLIRELLAFRPASLGTDLAGAMSYATRLLPPHSVLFLLSDFRFPLGPAPFERVLARASRRHDVVAVSVRDRREAELPEVGVVAWTDPETGERVVVDTGSRSAREEFARGLAAEERALGEMLARFGVDRIELRTGAPYVSALLGFFGRRERRLRR